jgi:hypothetical protein
MTNTNKTLLGGIFILFLLLLISKCEDNYVNTTPKTTTVVDTLYSTHIDTIPFYNIIDSIRWTSLTVISKTANADSTEFKYITDMSDSLLAGTINTTVKNDGTLVNQGFTYVPKFPKYIKQYDTIRINKSTTTTIIEKDWGLYGGLMISPYQSFSAIGTIGIKTKKDIYIGVGYEPFRQNIYLDIKLKILR